MSTVFTTWTALYETLLNQLQSGLPYTGTVSIGGKSITINSISFEHWLKIAEQRAAAETQAAGGEQFTLRTYAKPKRD